MPKQQPEQHSTEEQQTESPRRPRRRNPAAAPSPEQQQKKKNGSPGATAAGKKKVESHPEPETVGGHEPTGNNRRRRHKAHREPNGATPAAGADAGETPPQGIDTEELIRRAWKIYLGEVTEEGLALMDDRTADESAKRAFRTAEIFLRHAEKLRTKALRASQ